MSIRRRPITRRVALLAVVLALAVAVLAAAASSGRAAGGVPMNSLPPSITAVEAPQVGQTLGEVNGTWTPTPTSYAYQWYRCDSMGAIGSCTQVVGATAQSYPLSAADLGFTYRVTELASDAAGPASNAIFSAPTGVVIQPPPPTNATPPTISGAPILGATLTEARGTWNYGPTSFTLQWYDCDTAGNTCAAIGGATGQTYVLAAADVGHTIRVTETATGPGGPSTPTASTPTAAVATPPVSTAAPKVSGQAVVGGTLACTTGAWSGTQPLSYAYAWMGDGNTIAGATASTHKLAETDVAQAIGCVVKATNAAGSATSQSDTVLVTAAPACFGRTGVSLGECRARNTEQSALSRCSAISSKTAGGKARRAACQAKARLTYKRAVAVTKCQTIKSRSKRAACVTKARKIKK